MRCLFAVSSWFVQRASLTVNIDHSDVTNIYYTVLYRTVVVYERKNRLLVFGVSRKIQTLGPTDQWETRQASLPTGTVGPRFGIFLSPMMDSIYPIHVTRLSHPHDLLIPSSWLQIKTIQAVFRQFTPKYYVGISKRQYLVRPPFSHCWMTSKHFWRH